MKLILSIDGGGIRGLLPARLLQTLGAVSWDLIAGTSTGGIIAAGLCSGVDATTLVNFYKSHGSEVFTRHPFGGLAAPKYSPDNLERLLRQVLGTRLLSQAHPELLIPSYCIELASPADNDGDGVVENACSWFFKSWVARTEHAQDCQLWQVARATSAAPSYFPPTNIAGNWFVDGGVFANNPALCALAEARRLWPDEPVKVLSLGTGTKIKAVPGAQALHWGVAQWAARISSVFMDGAADSVTYQMQRLLGAEFLRCESPLVGVDDAFDNASPANIAALDKLADAYVAASIDRVKAFLHT